MLRNILLALTCVAALLARQASAQDGEHAGHQAGEVGTVDFPTSCSPAVQQQFNRAVATLHSFWYEEALSAFAAVAAADADCAMAQWGVAMSVWYPLWYPPGEASLRTGAAAVEKARALAPKTARERGYVEAIGAFYRDWDKLDYRTRSLAYETAMEQLHLQYPDDREAGVFYALALNATALPTDKTYANVRKAAAILEAVAVEQPGHPGVAHYLIHSYDYPPLAAQGLPAARIYAAIAPAVPHALHMPSHIFTRKGLWQESIESNTASAEAGQIYAAKNFGEGVAWDQSLHAMDYLEYAYLQGAQDGDAKRMLDQLASFRKAVPESRAAAYAVAAIPARYAVERRNWAEAAQLRTPPMAFAWERFPWAEAMVAFARALGAAHTGDIAGARAETARLEGFRDALLLAKDAYWADVVEIERRAAAAVLARAEGGTEDAVAQLRSAADLEASTEKSPVTPAPIAPARELLGDLLLELNQPAPALAEYERSLATEPNRFRSLYGAAKAAELSGDASKAKAFFIQLVALAGRADSERPELVEARAFAAE